MCRFFVCSGPVPVWGRAFVCVRGGVSGRVGVVVWVVLSLRFAQPPERSTPVRHVVGLLSGLVVGPVLVLMSGWAFAHLRALHGAGLSVVQGAGPLAVAGLVGVGLLVALMAVPGRLTPMLPFGAALAVGGLTAAALLRMHLLERLPEVAGTGGALVLLPLGVFVPVVVLLVAPLFVGGRWRRREEVSEEEGYFEGLYDDDEEEGPVRGRVAATASVPSHMPRHRA